MFNAISDCSAFDLVKWLRFNENELKDDSVSKNRYKKILHEKILNLFPKKDTNEEVKDLEGIDNYVKL